MKKILLATGNQGKAQEMLEFFGGSINFLLLSDFPEIGEPVEDGATFQENALKKARHYGDKFQVPTLGEDSGIIVSAFPEKFGLRTRREIECDTDEEWLEKFLKMMQEVENRQATFYSAIGFYDPISGVEKVALGNTAGIILEDLAAPMEQGIPASAIFIPEGSDQVYSAMDKTEKNRVSHRGKAAREMKEFLEMGRLPWSP